MEIQRQEPPDLTYEALRSRVWRASSLDGVLPSEPALALRSAGRFMVSLPESERTGPPALERAVRRPRTGPGAGWPRPGADLAGRTAFPPSRSWTTTRHGKRSTLAELEDRVLDDPENPDVHRRMADGLIRSRGARPGARRSSSSRWRGTRTGRTGVVRRRCPIGWWSCRRTASSTIRNGWSWPTGQAIGDRCWRPISGWATRWPSPARSTRR